MLIWVCALHCEAKPVIDFYRLKKSHDDSAFDLYIGDNMACVISGIGKVASAAATAWVAARFQPQASLAWINLGIAGAASHDIGQPFYLNQIIDGDSDKRFYPAPVATPAIPAAAVKTLSQASDDYHPQLLYDMEASGFIYAALRFSSSELTQSIKVVSDNFEYKTGNNRPQVSQLIHQNLKPVCDLAASLLALDAELIARSLDADLWQAFNSLAHFSQTQKKQLQVLLTYLSNRNHDCIALVENLPAQSSAHSIIATLEGLSHQDSGRL